MDSTVGGESANSYVDITYADSFVAESIGLNNWPDDTATKEAALIQATRLLDASFMWYGDKTVESQALDWPRDFIVDKNNDDVPEDIIPKVIKDGVCQLANNLLALGGEPKPSQVADSVNIGPIKLGLENQYTVELFDSVLISTLTFYGEPNFSKRRHVSSSKVVRV
ncbi:MAG: hypothetical protein LC687_05455 [Actinobacteria bacterium]|nr:hypothetical protein [Actinomycetota bacterium]MCA1807277.1 hypothetical protein [Actinomycetota bacterium]